MQAIGYTLWVKRRKISICKIFRPVDPMGNREATRETSLEIDAIVNQRDLSAYTDKGVNSTFNKYSLT